MTTEEIDNITPLELASLIDHTFLGAAGDEDAVKKLCNEAIKYNFGLVMVNPAEIKSVATILGGTPVKIGTVAGFPLGQNTTQTKINEAIKAIEDGANDVDFVANLRHLKRSNLQKADHAYQEELKTIVSAIREHFPSSPIVLKLIIETCYLTDEEKTFACIEAKKAGFDFVKTSTGFGTKGATFEDVKLMRAAVGPETGVKAAGGIRDLDTALSLLKAGANRLGCSAGAKIIEELKQRKQR